LEKIQAEEKKIKILRKELAAWHRAERIRKYIAAMRESAAKDAEWIASAERQADRLDPSTPELTGAWGWSLTPLSRSNFGLLKRGLPNRARPPGSRQTAEGASEY